MHAPSWRNLPLDTVPSLAVVNSIDQELRVHLDLPSLEDFAEGTQPGMGEEGQEPTLPRHGWQKRAHKCLEDQFVSEEVWPSLSDTDRAMSRSQRGPFAAAPFVALPTSRFSKFDAQVFRVLLRRRLRLPLPLSSRSCRCGRFLDPLATTGAGCSEAGVLGKRGFPLERAAEQVCREAGARVSTNVFVETWTWRNTTFWTIEGWRWWRTASLCGTVPSWRLTRHWCRLCTGMALRRKGPHTTELPSSTPAGGNPPRIRSSREKEDEHGWWCWWQKWADGSQKAASFVHALAKAKSRSQPPVLRGRVREALSRRWEGILACTAAKSFAVSLLDLRPACNTGMDPPSMHEVVRDCRFL